MSDVRRFLESFLRGIVEKRMDVIAESYLHADRLFVFLEGPRSRTLGWDNVRTGWEKYLGSRIVLSELTLGDDLQIRESAETAWAAASTRVVLSIDGGPPRTLEMRATWVLEKHTGAWRIAHEHVSLAHPDPYGVGDWAPTSGPSER